MPAFNSCCCGVRVGATAVATPAQRIEPVCKEGVWEPRLPEVPWEGLACQATVTPAGHSLEVQVPGPALGPYPGFGKLVPQRPAKLPSFQYHSSRGWV